MASNTPMAGSSSSSDRSLYTSTVWELGALAALTMVYLGSAFTDASGAAGFLNLAGPISLAAIMVVAMLQQLRTDSSSIWTAMFHFRANILAFFAVGSLGFYLIDDHTLSFLQRWNEVTPVEQLKANMVFAAGTLFIMVGAMFGRLMLPRLPARGAFEALRDSMLSQLSLAMVFILVGGFIRYFVMASQRLELSTIVLPGSLMVINNAYLVGVFLLLLKALNSRRPDLLVLGWGLVLFDLFVGVLMFNKSWALSPIMIAILAYATHRFSVMRFVTLSVSGILIYNFLVPLVAFGRQGIFDRTGGPTVASVQTRIEIISDYMNTPTDTSPGSWAMARFVYINAASFAIERYDTAGIPGETYHSVLELLIPRFLWPDKPVRRAGSDFNFAIDGTDTSASTPGLYAEAYWNGGWFYLMWAMAGFGAMLSVLSYHALRIFRNRAWVFLPLVFVYVLMGHSAGQMMMATIGSLPIMLVLYGALLLLHRILERKPVSSPAFAVQG